MSAPDPDLHAAPAPSAAPPASRPDAWARELGISREAVELYLASDVVDLHLDTFIWTRLLGYDPHRRHGLGPTGGRLLSQVDFPRVRDAALRGAVWIATTNPLRRRGARTRVLRENLDRLEALLADAEGFRVVRDAAGYHAARAAGLHAAWIGIQGGNALDGSSEAHALLADGRVVLVTLVHLSSSHLGTTSAPTALRRDGGLTADGCALVEQLDALRVFVDLAHVSRRGFDDATGVHDRALPLLVSHTGVSGVHRHWRNLDDAQLRAVAETGGTVGVMYQSSFLGEPWWGGRSEAVVRHLAHVVETVGEDHASLGSDWDGAICPPRDLRSPLELPRLVQHMLDRRWRPERIQKILGGNFLRALSQLRPSAAPREAAP